MNPASTQTAPQMPPPTLKERAGAWEVLDIVEAANYVGITVKSAREIAASGDFPGQLPRLGRKHRVSARQLAEWIDPGCLASLAS